MDKYKAIVTHFFGATRKKNDYRFLQSQGRSREIDVRKRKNIHVDMWINNVNIVPKSY